MVYHPRLKTKIKEQIKNLLEVITAQHQIQEEVARMHQMQAETEYI